MRVAEAAEPGGTPGAIAGYICYGPTPMTALTYWGADVWGVGVDVGVGVIVEVDVVVEVDGDGDGDVGTLTLTLADHFDDGVAAEVLRRSLVQRLRRRRPESTSR